MRWLPWVLLVAMISPFLPVHAQLPASVGDEVPLGPEIGQRVFVLVMTGTEFNGLSWPDSPLLEAYVGETLTFYVHVPRGDAPHTFHVHGHPWWDSDTDRFIDTKLMFPGDTHDFSVTAGTVEGNAGDWFYHCHIDQHFAAGMWGILRVYPYTTEVSGPLEALEVTVHREGETVPTTDLSLTLDGEPVDARIDRVDENRFTVDPGLPAGADGQLVIRADNSLGESLARLSIQDGSYELIRHVIPDNAEEILGDDLPDEVLEEAGTPDITVHQDRELKEAIP